MVIVVKNILTISKYIFNRIIGKTYSIHYENIDDEDDEEYCNCNLCRFCDTFFMFFTRRLVYKCA